MYKRILIPVDGRASSEAVIPHVKKAAQGMQSELIFLHVIPRAAPVFAPPARPFAKGVTARHKTKLLRYLKTLCATIERDGMRATFLIRDGGVADTILEVARIMQADLIAMCTRGRPAAQIMLLGNVTYQVVRQSRLPMLIVRSRGRGKRASGAGNTAEHEIRKPEDDKMGALQTI